MSEAPENTSPIGFWNALIAAPDMRHKIPCFGVRSVPPRIKVRAPKGHLERAIQVQIKSAATNSFSWINIPETEFVNA